MHQLFGEPGAVLLAVIFTLACLTTCVGLINSISQFFSTLFKKVSYRVWVFAITGVSFLTCNLGLNAILSISVPILNAIYPVAIMLILMGLSHGFWQRNAYAYPLTAACTACVSVLYALDAAGLSLSFVSAALKRLPLYELGFGWVSVAALALAVSFELCALKRDKKTA